MMTFKYTFRMALVAFILISIPIKSIGQDRIYGDFGGGWGANSPLTQTFGTSYMYSEVPSSIGNKYFRYMQSNTTPWTQWGPNDNGCNGDVQTGQGGNYQCINCSNFALYVNVNSTTNRWVFKTKNQTDGLTFCFDIGTTAIADISSYTTDYSDPVVGNAITISLYGNQLAGNQGVYLRYTTDDWTNSTVKEMTFSSNKYQADITSSDVTANSTIKYYFFVSKSGNLSNMNAADADLYTIAWNNNGGSNFQIKPVDFVYDNGSWNPTSPTFASTKDILIADDVTITSDVIEADVLFVRDNATITLDNGLSPTPTSYSQLKVAQIDLLDQSTIGVTQEQYLGSTGHHGISSPMTAGFTTTSGTSSTLYGYTASTGAWDMSPTTSTVGAGFFAPVQASNGFQSAAGTFSVTGTPNTGHTHTLGYSSSVAAGGSGAGWNLIGNPYTCGLDWTSGTIAKTNINDAIYIWDANSSTYKYYVDGTSTPSGWGGVYAGGMLTSGVIAPMQAFWVQVATNAAASIVSTMANDGTVASSPTFYKTTPDNLILYAEDLSDQSLSDAMWITHGSGYTNDFEGDRDAWKLSNYGGQANIYSYHNGEKMAINAIDLSSSPSIPVGVKAPANGKKYKLVLEQIVNNQDYQVILEDKLFNSFTDISNQGYSFTSGLWQNEDPRFVLHISQSTVGIGEESLQSLKLYQQGDRLIIQGNAQEHGRYSLITLDGRQVAEGVLQAGMANIQAPIPGVYIVQLSGDAPVAQRVLVH